MGLHFRKSFGKGGFRLNFSGSGVSYSFGVKGARVNVSNRGTYVTFGSNGIYYRKKISGPPSQQRTPPSLVPVPFDQHTITSGNVEEITDIDSQDFINELTEKEGKASYYKWLGVFPLVTIAIIFLFIFITPEQKRSVQVTETKYFIKPLSADYVNIRQTPDKKSKVLSVIGYGDQLELLDSSNSNWYKVNFNGQEAYVSKQFTERKEDTSIHEVRISNPDDTLYKKKPALFWTLLITLIIAASILLPFLKKIDKKRLLVEIYYDIDESINEVYQKFVYHFSELLKCSRAWQYLHSESTNDYKYSSGAGTTINRRLLTRISTNKTPSEIFKTNVEIPFLGLINTELYFFPERLIIKRGHQYGAIMYKNIDCFGETTRFIESTGVPGDAVVVGHTWRYLNKNGTPDRRFNNNYQIPICKYSEYAFRSASGLNERIAISKVGGIDEFIKYVNAIGYLQKKMSTYIG
jgi:hypothetical protein